MSNPEQTHRAQRLRETRKAAGFPGARDAARHFGWNLNTYASHENGNATFSYKRAKAYADAFGVASAWLYEGLETPSDQTPTTNPDGVPMPTEILVPIVGQVGADIEARVLFALGQAGGDLVPLPPGGSERAVALRVAGYSMPGLADDGALIYFEHQATPPTPDMLGQVVVVETGADEVLVKRLLRGSKPGLYDLEGLVGPTRRDCRLRWAAHITAIIPPHQARRIIRTASA